MKGSHFAASLSEPKAPGDFFSSSSWLQGLLWGFIISFNGWNFAGHAICKDLMSEVSKKKVLNGLCMTWPIIVLCRGKGWGYSQGLEAVFVNDGGRGLIRTGQQEKEQMTAVKNLLFRGDWLWNLIAIAMGWWCTSKVASPTCRKTCVVTNWLHWF